MADATPPPAANCFTLRIRILLFAFLGLCVLCGLIVAIFCGVYRPDKKPTFTLTDITVYSFNVSKTQNSEPYKVTTNMQVTVTSQNLNPRISFDFQNPKFYATYREHQITKETAAGWTHLGYEGIVLFSPLLTSDGSDSTVSPILGFALSRDANSTTVLLDVKIHGKVNARFKGGYNQPYDVVVSCPALIWFPESTTTPFVLFQEAMKFQPLKKCHAEYY